MPNTAEDAAAEPILLDRVIRGRIAARRIRAEVAAQVEELVANHRVTPQVVFVRVGDDPASETYVRGKARMAGKVGIHSQHIHLPDTTTETQLEDLVVALNRDENVHGILVQLPLPSAIGSTDVLNVIDPLKDVDGFHPRNLGALMAGEGPLAPCTPRGIMRLIDMIELNVRGLDAVVVGRSVIVGRPMASLLLRRGATVTTCHRHTQDLAGHTSRADIIVVATGVPGLITRDHVKPGAFIFDVGMNRTPEGKLTGDVLFDEVREVAAGLTPVPGGVGPMTIAQLLWNTVMAARIAVGLDSGEINRA